ncbi:CtsR family transcriptional regulator [Clostridium tyrobutyricum]|uniref:Transcriptional regulator CtsR n=1 Tax=Clostridium tyrobutyricum DIVETGP TaxID=1408889 RepID=W6N552_CLOTY|nr:CtsR family transcriptional regulator [Clostridium tyrobutyricum]AND86158.1 transcriptional regulator CtsR [Clostridium tyrobutyricum]ANP70655.1 CtsR family transcriptional regulator [Clostridium tyrobutyricum]MBR9649439.1 CtsR family transcriptional regulator [Clostridium tyrobutyricum]MBV4417530.1 CtsR family transcriptional regulator [Clostridium tyrobutyricum]MBV4422173.1 CtsR family transcriptional regulator [Clostridium tyrobutyricum]
MARLSDVIEAFIKDMLESSKEPKLQIGRNELASHFSCAPSQINYVLTTRFTIDKGYYIESKRGGGGCIIIKRVACNSNKNLLNIIIEKIGNNITYNSAIQIIDGLFEADIITERECNILKTVTNDRTFNESVEDKNRLRAYILKSAIFVIFNEID